MEAGLKEEYASADELHESLKVAFLSKKHFTKSGKEILKIGSTTNLSKTEFGEYIDKVNIAMTEWNSIDTSKFWEEYQEVYATL